MVVHVQSMGGTEISGDGTGKGETVRRDVIDASRGTTVYGGLLWVPWKDTSRLVLRLSISSSESAQIKEHLVNNWVGFDMEVSEKWTAGNFYKVVVKLLILYEFLARIFNS